MVRHSSQRSRMLGNARLTWGPRTVHWSNYKRLQRKGQGPLCRRSPPQGSPKRQTHMRVCKHQIHARMLSWAFPPEATLKRRLQPLGTGAP